MAGIKFVDNTEDEVVIKGTPKVPFNMSKKVSSIEGTDVIYFIDKNWGLANNLQSKMNFNSLFPTELNFCEITIPIDRV
tara:strand:- start:165 stop:401 length:237 start_codon:yes stop_codon:yes gene_type:complete